MDCEPSRCFRRLPALARGASCEFGFKSTTHTTLSLFTAGGSTGVWSVLRILFSIDGRLASAGAWSILKNLFGIDDPLAVFGGWQRWRVERPENYVWICLESTPFSLLSAGGSAGAWSVLKILLGVDDYFAVVGGWQHWCIERPENSACNQRPSRCFGRAAAPLARGASCEFCVESTIISLFSAGGSAGA